MSRRVIDVRWRGRVQGVGFRMTVRETARATGVQGWVRNESDGSVTGLLIGAADQIAAFRAALGEALARGPARVDRTDWTERVEHATDGEPAGRGDFEIRR